MVVEKQVPEFLFWIPSALLNWLLVCVVLVGVAVLLGYLVATLRNGPAMAIQKTGRLLRTVPQDLLHTSPRRIWALTRLAVKESIRRRVVVGFAVFIILLLFAGWFLDPGSERPARLYLDFVLSMTSFLVLLMALILSALSLPNDIKYRTIHTVVTKPVRPTEIVLGRVLGFTIIGTGMLLVMGLLSYGFVLRGLAHRHVLTGDDLREAGEGGTEAGGGKKTGFTSKFRDHRHEAQVVPGEGDSEIGQMEAARGHTHALTIESSAGEKQYRVGSPEGMLQARVPIYGKLRFRGPKGTDKEKGINVGDEWAYRSYITGGSDAAAIWSFSGITEDAFPRGLNVEMTLGVFRTYKGDIEKGVLGGLSVRNPKTGLTIEVEIFESVEFSPKRVFIPRKIKRFSGAQIISQRRLLSDGTIEALPPLGQMDPSLAQKDEYDLFEDLVSDGTVEVWLQCLETSQYFGAAQADLYLRARDAWFLANFAKGYLGIWIQMVLVVGFGVMFSTFLSAPVAAFATVGILSGGFFKQFMADLGRGEVIGGGPFEALVRLVRQDNLIVDLNPGLGTKLMEMFDNVAEVLLRAMAAILPPFADFGFNAYVAEGYDVSLNVLAVRTITMLAFLIPVLLAGYLFLKTREVSQ